LKFPTFQHDGTNSQRICLYVRIQLICFLTTNIINNLLYSKKNHFYISFIAVLDFFLLHNKARASIACDETLAASNARVKHPLSGLPIHLLKYPTFQHDGKDGKRIVSVFKYNK
jgi:hypothetical protein